MKKNLILLSCVLLLSLLTSCATIFDDDTQAVFIDSVPAGATIKVDGYPSGETPAILWLAKDSSHVIELSKEGYASQTIQAKKSIKWGWQVLDFFTTGLIGNVVDIVSGNGYKITPDKIHVDLVAR